MSQTDNDPASPKRDYASQKKYYRELGAKGIVRHAILIDRGTRDSFVALAKTLQCSQGELVVGVMKVAESSVFTDALGRMIVRKESPVSARVATRASKKKLRDTLAKLTPEQIEKALAAATAETIA